MSSNRQYSRDEILPLFWRLHEALVLGCVQCGYVGSLRRRAPYLSEIDMLLLPFVERVTKGPSGGLFEAEEIGGREVIETHPLLDAALARLLREGVLVPGETPKDGDKYKRFRLAALDIGVDLFIAKADNFGYLQAIRTGPAEFSHALVTARHLGGLRPNDLRCKAGYVWRQTGAPSGLSMAERVPMPDEWAFFHAWGLPWIPAKHREVRLIGELRRDLGLLPMPLPSASTYAQKGA